jgi:hypothetical protein
VAAVGQKDLTTADKDAVSFRQAYNAGVIFMSRSVKRDALALQSAAERVDNDLKTHAQAAFAAAPSNVASETASAPHSYGADLPAAKRAQAVLMSDVEHDFESVYAPGAQPVTVSRSDLRRECSEPGFVRYYKQYCATEGLLPAGPKR